MIQDTALPGAPHRFSDRPFLVSPEFLIVGTVLTSLPCGLHAVVWGDGKPSSFVQLWTHEQIEQCERFSHLGAAQNFLTNRTL